MKWHSERVLWNIAGRCARKCCQMPMGEGRHWNKGSELYYCASCARRINKHSPGLCVSSPPGSEKPDR